MTRRTESAISLWPAPAKINLFLHVTGRRADGYHELQTLFQLLDWGDEVSIRATPGAEINRGAAEYPVAAEDDLAIRAARLLQRHTNCREGAEISVRKRIPLGSGMGGGSSNAATVLLALQTAVTAWPITADRMTDYLVKSAREADLHTSWTTPDEAYEAGYSDGEEKEVQRVGEPINHHDRHQQCYSGQDRPLCDLLGALDLTMMMFGTG